MSTTTYQTTAKPRRRRDTDFADPQIPSRTSSHASQKLTKTISRPLEDSSTQAKSRPHSPAMFWQRNKAIDPSGPRDSITISPKSPAITSDAPERSSGQYREAMTPTKPEAERSQSSMPPSATTAYFNKLKGPDSPSLGRSHSRSRTRSLTQSMIARMQPTVADTSDDDVAREAGRARSSATSLELNSANTSEVGTQPLAKTTTSPAVPQSFEAIGEPLKPSYSTPNTAGTRKSSPPQKPVDYQGQLPSTKHYAYPTPPGSFPSPPQNPLELTASVPQRSVGYGSPQQRPIDTPKPNARAAAATPTVSPPHSPRLTQPPPMYNAPPVPYSYGYPPQLGHEPGPVTYYSRAEPHFMPNPPLTQKDVARSIPGENKDDHQRDWHKVTSVLPELNRLLAHFEDQKGQSASKESFSKQLDFQRTQEMAKLRVELEVNKEEYEKVIQKLVSESYKYKSEIREQDERMAKMQSTIDDLKTQHHDYAMVKTKHSDSTVQHEKLRKEHESLLSKHEQTATELQALRKTHESLQKKAENSVADMQHYKKESTGWKDRYQEASAASDQARLAKEDLVSVKMRLEDVAEELRRKLHGKEDKHQAEVKAIRKEFEVALESKEKEKSDSSTEYKAIVAGIQMELAGLTDRHSRAKKDLEAARSACSSLEKKAETSKKDFEAQEAWHRQQMENKDREMENRALQLTQQIEAKNKHLDEQNASHRYQLESQLASLTSQRERELEMLKDEQAQALRRLFQDHEAEACRVDEQHASEVRKIQRDLDGEKDAFGRYRKETEALRAGHGELAATMISWRTEQDKLNKVLETLGLSSKMHDTQGA